MHRLIAWLRALWIRPDPLPAEYARCKFCEGGALPGGMTRVPSNLVKIGKGTRNPYYRHMYPEACAITTTLRRRSERGPLARLVWNARNRLAA